MAGGWCGWLLHALKFDIHSWHRYSGDTMPSDTLAQAGEGATLLIHEATMGDDQVEMASAKAHSTISQAINVAKR
jgi:ribonuclease Z